VPELMKWLRSFAAGALFVVTMAVGRAADVTPPAVEFRYPTDGMVLTTNWPAIRGVASDEPGGSGLQQVTISILAPDGTFWNGSAYVAEPVALSTVITDGTNWARTGGIPVKHDLQTGEYTVFAKAVDVAGNPTEISIVVTMNVPPPPPNDDFEDAELIPGNEGGLLSNTLGATREEGEPLHASVEGSASVWYKWVAPEAGFLTASTFGSTIDTIMGVYTGNSVSSLTLQDGNDDGGELGSSIVSISVAADATYHIAIDGKFGAAGGIALNWQFSSSARPRLRMRTTNSPSASVVVSWPSASQGFTLYSSLEAAPASWSVVPEAPSTEGEQQVVILPATGPRRFFRLEKP
jgi:hypothetical protein